MINLLSNKKLLIFDLDETIYDHQYASLSGLKAMAKEFPKWLPHNMTTIENMYFEDLHHSHLKVIDGHLSEEDSHIARFQKLARHHNLEFLIPEYLQMIEIYNQVSKNSKRAIPNAPETIAKLKKQGFTIGIITNGKTENQKNKIKLCDIHNYLDFALISEEVGIRKPAKEIFELALTIGKAKPSQAIMIGDSWDSDILGAKAANIQPVWVNRGRHQNHDTKSVIEIKHINELLK